MGRNNGGMGDYQALTPHRTITNELRPLGPLQTPLVMPPGQMTQAQILAELFNRLDAMPRLVGEEFRKLYRKQGRDGQDFIYTSAGQVTVPSGVLLPTTIVTFTVQQNFEGSLYELGTMVIPAQGSPYIEWSLRINGGIIHPGLNKVVFMANTLAAPLSFETELLQAREIELIAENTHPTDNIDVCAILKGSTAFMSGWKKWADRPTSGIG